GAQLRRRCTDFHNPHAQRLSTKAWHWAMDDPSPHHTHGIGPWMTRVRITHMWQELDFMRTNGVTSLNLLPIDDDICLSILNDHIF
ncbi:hypothetical protein MKX01_023350, partial [Papaver californicum]